ncbi:ATP-binding protein [Dactylosporangium salmoneum]|uniref:AAA family ATPase n=1 Tax=Dactylosporangium salmoneum TaxID=53361 RepID=A0ABN3HCF1_9ACTN
MPLWERAEALAELDELSRAGGRVVLVAGEAGIGKTSLIRAFAAKHPTWLGVCDPLVTPRALGPLHDIGRQAGGALASTLGAQEPPGRVFAALLDALAKPRPPIVVVEDLHWADAASLDLLVLLARRIDRLRALLVLTYRDDEAPDHPLHAALAAFPRDVVRRVSLPRLSRDCVAEQAAGRDIDPATVYALTGGNPLLVTEMLGSADPTAGAVGDLILARLRRLPPEARDLAELAAVLQRLDVSGDGPEAALVDRCVAEGVLVAVEGGVGFRHELLRRSVEDALPPGRRRALHLRAVRRLARVEGVDPARLAHHAGLSEDPKSLRLYGGKAAETAAAQGAHREAAAHYRALLAVGGIAGRPFAESLEVFAFQAYLAGQFGEAMAARRRAVAERRGRGEPERVGENERWISRLAWWMGDPAQARLAAEAAVSTLEAAAPGRELAMAYSNRAQLHMLAHELGPAIDLGTRAADLAERVGDPETAVNAGINVATARLLREGPDDGDAPAELVRRHRRAAALGFPDDAARALVNRATSLMWLGDDMPATAAAIEDALAYAAPRDLDGYVQYLLGVRGCVRAERGDWDGALRDAAEALAYPNPDGVAVVPAYLARGRVLSGRGDPGAEGALDRALELALGIAELQRVGAVTIVRAEHFLINGAPDRAADEARRGLALAVSRKHPRYTSEIGLRLWLATGEPVPVVGAFADLVQGDWRSAAQMWGRAGRTMTRVHALAAGDAAAAGEALATLDAAGARRGAEWLRGRLRQRGVTGVPRGPRPATAANAAGLTGRQAEVLRLVAEGRSNAEIAARLALSEKTVQHHVSAVLAKLEVTTRTQAAVAARRLGLG